MLYLPSRISGAILWAAVALLRGVSEAILWTDGGGGPEGKQPLPKAKRILLQIHNAYSRRNRHMHRHRGFRHHGPRHFHRLGFFPGFFWPIGLAFLLFGGHWWPAILILIGLSVIFGSFFHDERPMEPRNPPPPVYKRRPMTPPPAPRIDPAPVQQIHRLDLLPLTCSQCGGPIRSYEVKWTGAQSAACPYCGSNLKMKKA